MSSIDKFDIKGSKLTATFEVVTPIFMGGANEEDAELRSQSIKGALRWWYRAIDPDYNKNIPNKLMPEELRGKENWTWEEYYFGSSNRGQSPIFLDKITAVNIVEKKLEKYLEEENKLYLVKKGNKFNYNSDLYYLLYFFFIDDYPRYGIYPDSKNNQISFECILNKINFDQEILDTWIISLYILGTLGNIGFRSRRAMGSIMLKDIKNGDSEFLKDTIYNKLDLSKSNNINTWFKKTETNIKKIYKYFENKNNKSEFQKIKIKRFSNGYENKFDALNELAQKYKEHRKEGDYKNNFDNYKNSRERPTLPYIFKLIKIKEEYYVIGTYFYYQSSLIGEDFEGLFDKISIKNSEDLTLPD